MNRKTQLEKFHERQNKARKDEEVIKTAEVKNSTIEKRAGKVVTQYGMSTEDIFMIIARESVGPFVKMWNNSMENVIRDTIKTEVRSVIQEVVQEELAAAVRGFMKGLMPTPEEIQEAVKESLNPEPEFQNGLQQLAFESKLDEMKQETDEYVKSFELDEYTKSLQLDNPAPVEFIGDEETREAIIKAHYMGLDPTSGKIFRTINGRNNTLYQRFGKKYKGTRGSWKEYVTSVLASIKNEEA